MKTAIDKQGVIYPELSYSIVGAAMDVHNELGPGWNEWDYHRAMIEALGAKGHEIVSHERKALVHRGTDVDHFELDLLVDDLIILELKHIKMAFHPVHFTQIINYLKHWDKRLGMLINYGMDRLGYKRIPYDPVGSNLRTTGKWEELRRRIPALCERIESSVTGVLAAHGYGYGVATFKNLLIAELSHFGSAANQPTITPAYGPLTLDSRIIDCVSVDSELLLSVTATGQCASSTDLAYLKSYMKQMKIPYGVLVDIGCSEIQLKGVL